MRIEKRIRVLRFLSQLKGVTYKYMTNSLRDFIKMKNFPGSQEEKETFATEAATYMWKNRGGKNALKLETTKSKIAQKRGFS